MNESGRGERRCCHSRRRRRGGTKEENEAAVTGSTALRCEDVVLKHRMRILTKVCSLVSACVYTVCICDMYNMYV